MSPTVATEEERPGRWAALMAWVRPPRRIRPTRAGWFALVTPFFLGLAAINASNNLLFLLLAASLGAIVLSGILSERNLRGVRASLRPVDDAYAGEPARLLLSVERKRVTAGDVPLFAIRVREIARKKTPKDQRLDAVVPVIEGPSARAVASRVFPRRGLIDLRRLEVVTTYPFGLLAKSKDLDLEAQVLVRPRRVPVPEALADPAGLAAEGRASSRRGLGEDVYGLRERHEWDPHHRVHALRSARVGREVVIETEATERPVAWIGVANTLGADPEAFERTLEVALATVREWEENGWAVGLRTAGALHPPGSADLGELLALLELEKPRTFRADAVPLWLVPERASLPEGSAQAPKAFIGKDGALRFEKEARA